MTKHKTDNLELVTLDDVDGNAFYPDYVANLLKLNGADKARLQALAANATAVAAEAVSRAAGDDAAHTFAVGIRDALTSSLAGEVTRATGAETTNAAAIASETQARIAALAGLFVNGKIDPTLLPSVSLTNPPVVVAAEAVMLALNARVGDIAKRTDIDGGAPFMLAATPLARCPTGSASHSGSVK